MAERLLKGRLSNPGEKLTETTGSLMPVAEYPTKRSERRTREGGPRRRIGETLNWPNVDDRRTNTEGETRRQQTGEATCHNAKEKTQAPKQK